MIDSALCRLYRETKYCNDQYTYVNITDSFKPTFDQEYNFWSGWGLPCLTDQYRLCGMLVLCVEWGISWYDLCILIHISNIPRQKQFNPQMSEKYCPLLSKSMSRFSLFKWSCIHYDHEPNHKSPKTSVAPHHYSRKQSWPKKATYSFVSQCTYLPLMSPFKLSLHKICKIIIKIIAL